MPRVLELESLRGVRGSLNEVISATRPQPTLRTYHLVHVHVRVHGHGIHHQNRLSTPPAACHGILSR